jgi:hypothetical protein
MTVAFRRRMRQLRAYVRLRIRRLTQPEQWKPENVSSRQPQSADGKIVQQ